MKRIIGALVFTFMLVLLNACSDDNKAEGDFRDIGLETGEFIVSGNSHSIVAKTVEPAWGISLVRIFEKDDEDGIIYHNTLEMEDTVDGGSHKVWKESISHEFFTVTKSAPNELTVSLQENNTGKERKIMVELAGGVGYMGADVYVTQKAKE